MRNTIILLGLGFVILYTGAYFAFDRSEKRLDGEFIIVDNEIEIMSLTLTSPAFEEGETIPVKHTCEGENVSPELVINGVPDGTESLVLVMDDPDIPQSVKDNMGIEKFDHWVLYNIPVDIKVIEENTSPGTVGHTSRGGGGYVGACPPDKEHRYIFRLYALSGVLDFVKAPTLDEVETAAKGMSIEAATLIGLYNKIENQ